MNIEKELDFFLASRARARARVSDALFHDRSFLPFTLTLSLFLFYRPIDAGVGRGANN